MLKHHVAACTRTPADVEDVDAYLEFRGYDIGGWTGVTMVEVSTDIFLPSEIRADPRLQQLERLTVTHLSIVNDIMSFEKEATQESNGLNLIKLLKDTQCVSVNQALKQAMELANNVTHTFDQIEVEWQALSEPESVVYRFVGGLKQLMTMNHQWHLASKRYMSLNSRFPELRSKAF